MESWKAEGRLVFLCCSLICLPVSCRWCRSSDGSRSARVAVQGSANVVGSEAVGEVSPGISAAPQGRSNSADLTPAASTDNLTANDLHSVGPAAPELRGAWA